MVTELAKQGKGARGVGKNRDEKGSAFFKKKNEPNQAFSSDLPKRSLTQNV